MTRPKIYKNITLTPTLDHFGYPGGASRGQKVIWLGPGFFLAERVRFFAKHPKSIPGIRFGGSWTLVLTSHFTTPPRILCDILMFKMQITPVQSASLHIASNLEDKVCVFFLGLSRFVEILGAM